MIFSVAKLTTATRDLLIFLGCCGNFTDFPTILNEVLRKNASNLQNAPAFFIPFRVNSFSAAQYKQQFKPSYPAKNTISGNFQGDGRRSRNTESEESNGGRFSREYSFDGNSNYGGFVGNEVFGGNRFGTNIYESVGEVNRFGNSKNQGGYSNRGIYGGGLGRYN